MGQKKLHPPLAFFITNMTIMNKVFDKHGPRPRTVLRVLLFSFSFLAAAAAAAAKPTSENLERYSAPPHLPESLLSRYRDLDDHDCSSMRLDLSPSTWDVLLRSVSSFYTKTTEDLPLSTQKRAASVVDGAATPEGAALASAGEVVYYRRRRGERGNEGDQEMIIPPTQSIYEISTPEPVVKISSLSRSSEVSKAQRAAEARRNYHGPLSQVLSTPVR